MRLLGCRAGGSAEGSAMEGNAAHRRRRKLRLASASAVIVRDMNKLMLPAAVSSLASAESTTSARSKRTFADGRAARFLPPPTHANSLACARYLGHHQAGQTQVSCIIPVHEHAGPGLAMAVSGLHVNRRDRAWKSTLTAPAVSHLAQTRSCSPDICFCFRLR
jgi:hypothetical protein